MDESNNDAPIVEKIEASVTPKKNVKQIVEVAEVRYKLIVYTSSGTLKPSISAGIFMEMGRQHGDIIRSVSSARWMTLDEICELVWTFERKMKNPSNRTKKAILDALEQLVERSFVTKR